MILYNSKITPPNTLLLTKGMLSNKKINAKEAITLLFSQRLYTNFRCVRIFYNFTFICNISDCAVSTYLPDTLRYIKHRLF